MMWVKRTTLKPSLTILHHRRFHLPHRGTRRVVRVARIAQVDGAVSQGFEAIFGKAEEPKAKKLMD